MNLKRIINKLIKPQNPTPQHLRNYNISFVDQFMEPMNLAVVLFYQSKPENISQLEQSLAKILVNFYPLAGRYIKNDHLVDCSDQGAEFVEAEALDVKLTDLIAKTDAGRLNNLLPEHYFQFNEAAANPLLSIQVTSFPCGGLAVAVSVSHRVFDASSLGTFIAAWSSACNPDRAVEITPSFHIPSLLPYMDLGLSANPNEFTVEPDKIVLRRVHFDKEALMSLRSKISGTNISRVRVVCAVIAKALIGVDRGRHGRDRGLFIIQPMNMRERTVPPQPKDTCGNLSIPSFTRRVASSEAKEIGIQGLVDVIGESVRKSIADYAEIVSPDRDGRGVVLNALGSITQQVWDPETNAVVFTDWSKFGFYEADFGLGKPVWTSIGPARPCIATAVLMSDKEGDGIEAWVHLSQDEISYFEQDPDIKHYLT